MAEENKDRHIKDKPSFPARLEGWEYQYERAEKAEALAASQLKLLRRLNDPRYLKKCPFCFGGPVEGWGTFCHIADCELAKELSDDK